MQDKNALFLLIECLSPSEKRYFKVFANRHVVGEFNDYVLIFDAIDAQTIRGTYDEAAVIAALARSGRQPAFAAAKSYLYALILRSMRQFTDEATATRQLEAALHNIHFLLEKGLLNKAMAVLRKALKLAETHDKPQLTLALLATERQIVRMQQTRHTADLLEQLEAAENRALERWRTELDLRRLYDRLHVHIREARQLTPEARTQLIRKYADNPLLRKRPAANTFGAEVLRLNSLSDLAGLAGDHQKARSHLRQLMLFYEAQPHQLRDEVLRYINVLNNYLTRCFQLKKFGEFPAVLKKMKALEATSREVRYQIFRNGVLLELVYLMNMRRPEEGLKLVPEIENGLRLFERKLPVARMLSFRYNVVVLYFLNERFNDALRALNRLREREHPDVRHDIQHAARLFQLLLHFELGHLDYLESLLRSNTRYLREHNRYGAFEQWLFRVLRHLVDEPDLRERKRIYRAALDEHAALVASGAKDLLLDEIGIWLNSRVSGKPLRLVFAQG